MVSVAPRPVLYSLRPSHYCACIERALALKGIRFDIVQVPYHDKRRLLRDTHQDYAPAMRHGRRIVSWGELPRYVEHLAPEPTLYPPGQEALAETLENWGHEVLEARVWPAVVTEIGALFRDPVESWVFEEMQSRTRGSFDSLRARRAELDAAVMPHFDRIDRMLAGRPYLLDQPSLADCGVYGGVWPWLMVRGSAPPRFRRLNRWIERVRGWGTAAGPRGSEGPAGRPRSTAPGGRRRGGTPP